MRTIALPALSTLLDRLRSRTFLHLETLVLRQQLAMVNQTPRHGSDFTGVNGYYRSGIPTVAELPADTAGLQNRYPGALASQGLSAVLDLEIPLPDGCAPSHRTRGAQAYPYDVSIQYWLGCSTADSRRTSTARHPRFPSDSRKVHGPSSYILLWTNNARNHARSCYRTRELSSPSRMSAACIMSTAAPPQTRSQ